MPTNRKPYPSDVSDEEWTFVAPYLVSVREDAPQRTHDLGEVFNGLWWIVRAGASWRMLPHDLPPRQAVYQQTQRWLSAGAFEAMVHDLRALLRLAEGRASGPTAAILDSRTLRSSPESGHRVGYDGAKRKKASKAHAAVDTLGQLLALHVTPADEQDRAQVEALAEAVQEATGESVDHSLHRSGVHRGGAGRGGSGARHPTGGGQAAGERAGLRAAAETLGGRAGFRVGVPLSALGEGLRAAARHGGRHTLRGLRLPLRPPSGHPARIESITPSSVFKRESP